MQVTVLGEAQLVTAGRLADLSGRGMCVKLDSQIPAGTLIRVEIDGTMLLGEVCYCNQDGVKWVIGLQVEHALTHSDDLARLMRQLVNDSTPGCVGPSVAEAPARDRVRLRTQE